MEGWRVRPRVVTRQSKSKVLRGRDWKRFTVGVKRTEVLRRVSSRGQAVLEHVWFDFFLTGERVTVKSEVTKRVALRDEHCWNELIDGNSQLRRRKENKRQAEESENFLRTYSES